MKIIIAGNWKAPIVKRLAKKMMARGHDIIIASFELSSTEKIKGIIFEDLGELRSHLDYFKFWKINKLVNKYRPDVVHAHYTNHYGLMSLFIPVPLVVALWGSDILMPSKKIGRIKKTVLMMINKIILYRANFVHSSSMSVIDKSILLCAQIEKKSEAFYWGLSIDEPDGDALLIVEKALEIEFGLKGNGFYIFPRGLAPVYNPDLVAKIINIMSGMKLNKSVVVLKAFSNDKEENKFLSKVDRSSFHYINRLLNDTELYSLYGRSAYHLSLPLSDSLGGGVIEPLQLGSIPIVSDILPYKNFIQHSIGMTLKSESESDIINMLSETIDSKMSYHKNIGQYSQEHVLEKIENIYKKAIDFGT
ncbi:glycosyltransferase [Vibrio sp. VB16]|uniref:glycosyltransferase n=1 Tax=Vibrio sp. VB16 TaxID=2785746 RepID=UPI0018A0EFBA|nr:glycosyltransferase [Vibrio sp. VB16]UGA54984.1 hypothetical protein IUZ65_000975 [Vibrio sp. VB16]